MTKRATASPIDRVWTPIVYPYILDSECSVETIDNFTNTCFFFFCFFLSETLFQLINVLRICHAVPSKMWIFCPTVLKFEIFSPWLYINLLREEYDSFQTIATDVWPTSRGPTFPFTRIFDVSTNSNHDFSFSPPVYFYFKILKNASYNYCSCIVHREQSPRSDFLFSKI